MKQTLIALIAALGLILSTLAFEKDGKVKTVTIEGSVGNVSLVAGQGMCFLTVKPAGNGKPASSGTEAEAEQKVILGSMRFLIDQGFTPRAGDAIRVVGIPMADKSLAASRIDLPERKQSVQFRDEQGRPLWSGGRQAGPMEPGMGGGPGIGGGRGGSGSRGSRGRGGRN
ncbi:MAG: hypothetical protein U5J83_02595 [Bryobacterales bacterium]|nr:hypothetical protein [Bryobacterales bacterium]